MYPLCSSACDFCSKTFFRIRRVEIRYSSWKVTVSAIYVTNVSVYLIYSNTRFSKVQYKFNDVNIFAAV